jgi:two-component system, chemotaxis family, sensor kinase CheA
MESASEPNHYQPDDELLLDFVTEATELLEQVDQDLVSLEGEPENTELLNNVFRAMHTIKGSGSFLGLTRLCEFTHAAEDALNVLRKGQAELDASTMDVLLSAIDVVKRQTTAIREGQQPEEGPDDLVRALQSVGSDGSKRQSSSAATRDDERVVAGGADDDELVLSASKLDLLPFMVEDLLSGLDELSQHASALDCESPESSEAEAIHRLAEELTRSVEFFEAESLSNEMSAVRDAAAGLMSGVCTQPQQVMPRLQALISIMRDRATALRACRLVKLSTGLLCERLLLLAVGQKLQPEDHLEESADLQAVYKMDQITEYASSEESSRGTSSSGSEGEQDDAEGSAQQSEAGDSNARSGKNASAPAGEQTIRVDVARLESLLNLMGELVLQKNRVVGISRKLANSSTLDPETQEDFDQIASDLDRVAAELQMGVMKARMQPMHKLFSRYPRVIRDLSRMTGKKIELDVTGAETEVDKSVVEALGDPLMHILRNSADHGIEPPANRLAAGKSEQGTIWLAARHDGNHVVVTIRDDGRGIDAKKIGQKAVEKGMLTAEDVEEMTDSQLLQIIFAPGFSTAATVSDLSGRGVGMDVVRTNITRLNGTVEVSSTVGQGSCVVIRIPLTLAIMPAMMVSIGTALYALPLSNIVEIVRPSRDEVYTVQGQQVMRLRDQVLPLVDLRTAFSARQLDVPQPPSESVLPTDKRSLDGAFAVVAVSGDRRAGLLVDGLVGQQEVVIKPLDDLFDHTGAVSGATVREDGGVSLIVDIGQLLSSVRDVA